MIRLSRPPALINSTIQLPWSKSVLNRVLVLKKLAGDSLTGIFQQLDAGQLSNDVNLMQINLTEEAGEINVQDAGTVMRFLTAYYCLQGTEVFLHGTGRMHERPVRRLVDALRTLGAVIHYEGKEGFPPLRISPARLQGGNIEINATESSQFISALLLIAPYLNGGLRMKLSGTPVSVAYIELTIDLMKQWGAQVVYDGQMIQVAEGTYTPNKPLSMEADWSAASYWYAMVSAIPGSQVVMPGLNIHSAQGDRVVAAWMRFFGVETAATEAGCTVVSGNLPVATQVEWDFSGCPDLVPTFVVTCLLHGVHGIFHGVAHVKLKESDRIEALIKEAEKIDAKIRYRSTGTLEIIPHPVAPARIAFQTHHDHRMAMSLACLSCASPVELDNELVVAKSYPNYWNDLMKAGFTCK